MDYEIVATLGPSTSDPGAWRSLLESGATAFRLNTSHLDSAELLTWLERLQRFFAGWKPGSGARMRNAAPHSVPVVLDLQGSKWRLGAFPARTLVPGERLELVEARSTAAGDRLPVPHPDFFAAAILSTGELVLNDARVHLAIESAAGERVTARVVRGGPVAPGKGITVRDSTFRTESLSEKDRSIFEATRELGFVRYAISYVRDAIEMASYRSLCGTGAYLIAKIERRPAVDEGIGIASAADELWLCRGDLGAELGLARMAEAAHRFAELPARLATPILLAGQLLEHMTANPDPTRAELCQLYDALAGGYRGVVLSDETAIGSFAADSVRAAAMFRSE